MIRQQGYSSSAFDKYKLYIIFLPWYYYDCMKRVYYIILFLVFSLPVLGNGDRYIEVAENFTSIKVKRQCRVLLDRTGALSFSDVENSENKFLPSEKEIPSYGYTDSVIWISVALHNHEEKEKILLLEVQNPIVDEVIFFDPSRDYKDPKKAGDMVPFDTRDVSFRNPVFRVAVKPGKSKYYLRIKTTSNSNVPLVFWSEESFSKHREIESIVLWTFYGLMLAMMLYNFIIYIFIREWDYLYYVLFILGFMLFRLAYNGLAFQYLWSNFIWWANVCVPFLVAFVAFSLGLFSRHFMRLWEGPKLLDYSLKALVVFFLFGMFFSLFAPYNYSIQLILGFVIVFILVLLAGSILALRWARRQAVFYMIAWIIFLIGSFLNIFRDFGLLPHNFLTAWGQQIGSAIQVLLLSIGLADRINIMRSTITRSNEELTRANRDLLHEREQMAVTLRSIEEGVVTCNLAGNVKYMNRSMIDILGVNALEVVGKPIHEVIHISDREDPGRDIIPQLFSVSGISETREAVLFLSDDDQRIIEYTISPLRDQKSIKHGILLVVRDISERKRLEEEMVKKNKLDAMGTLAGGIAHDFNNILTGLTGNIGMALLSSRDNPEVSDLLEEAERISFKARNITQQFLTFARGGSPVRTMVRLKNLIQETVSFTLSGSTVSAEYSVADDLWGVSIDEGQISQVINNIVLNAVQAMPDGGEIEIAAANIVIKGKHKEKEDYVKVTIRDHGPGIPNTVLSYIFDPFYTTKEKGNGLGLSSCYFIIEQHDGFIDVDTAIGRGTAFSVFLPSAGSIAEDFKEDSATEQPAQGFERILVMDDEDIIRRSTGKILERLGYDVVLALDGKQAVELFQRSLQEEKPFDVVILDLTIPGGMGGKEAVLELKKLNENILAIASSGYSNDPVMADFKKFGFTDILIKPYTVELLAQVLQRVLKKM